MSSKCSENPKFCNANKVVFGYCDGNSFTGMRENPLTATRSDGTDIKLYFRGRAILDETIAVLHNQFGLASATSVLLTGCSAGGLAAIINADHVRPTIIISDLISYLLLPPQWLN